MVADRATRAMAESRGREGGVSQGQHTQGGRVVFNIKGNDFRLVEGLQYRAGVLAIRFFGAHREYDAIDAEAV
jgi:mRNA-degrading endonuclease HigB of HigAB toxin-antitoxin module